MDPFFALGPLATNVKHPTGGVVKAIHKNAQDKAAVHIENNMQMVNSVTYLNPKFLCAKLISTMPVVLTRVRRTSSCEGT